jgi:predicted deacylase
MMPDSATVEARSVTAFQRVLGCYGGIAPGPLVIGIGGIHGNEPAGVRALQRVLVALAATAPPFKGEMVALAGNLNALYHGWRYVHCDLNRRWLPERVERLKAQPAVLDLISEDSEQRELLAEIEAVLDRRRGPAIFFDLHTTSSAGAPFALISDTLTNRHIAFALGVPLILGLEESLDGTILNYINELGHAAIGFEAGQHEALDSLRNHEAAIWLGLVAAGCLAPQHVPAFDDLRRQLREAGGSVPRVMELRYRCAVTEEDQFVMLPGFANFTPVTRGQQLAHDWQGKVMAPEEGLLFMPLYQKQGDDGFFLVREVRLFWLHISAWLRRARFDRLLPLLPGVSRVPGQRRALEINTRIAHWFVIEICHLLGFRKHTQVNGRLVVSRRRQSVED